MAAPRPAIGFDAAGRIRVLETDKLTATEELEKEARAFVSRESACRAALAHARAQACPLAPTPDSCTALPPAAAACAPQASTTSRRPCIRLWSRWRLPAAASRLRS